MKAIKIYKIVWNLNDVEPSKRNEELAKLPDVIAFKPKDENYNVATRVPERLKKLYKHDVITFSFTEYHIAKDIEEFLEMCKPLDAKKVRKIFNDKGKLTAYGEAVYSRIHNAIFDRKRLEEKGTDEKDMPKFLDEVMLSVENITGLSWDDTSADDLDRTISKLIWDLRPATFVRPAFSVKMGKTSMPDMDDPYEDEDDED